MTRLGAPSGSALARFRRGDATSATVEDEDDDTGDVDVGYFGAEIVRGSGLPPAEANLLAALASAAVIAVLSGSTRMPISRADLESALGADLAPAAHRLLERAAATGSDPVCKIIGRPGERKPLILDQGWLYLERMFVLEARFADQVRARVSRGEVFDPRAVRRALEALEVDSVQLARAQRVGIENVFKRPLTLISGGPGTGKTTMIVSLVRVATWIGTPTDALAVAAPTGKATQRLSDALARLLVLPTKGIAFEAARRAAAAPTTLHRLLAWSPARRRFAYHENNRLPQRLVIIDEASMVDLATMEHLLRAMREDARLVFVGDADQLPSVEAGAAFRDLCAALGCIRLASNYRVGTSEAAGRLITAADAVNRGTLAGVVTRRSADAVAFEGVEHLDARWPDVGRALLNRWSETYVPLDDAFMRRVARTYGWSDGVLELGAVDDLSELFSMYDKSRLLCATRSQGSPASADAINRTLMGRLRDHGLSLRSWRTDGLTTGAPVLVQRNDYRRGVYNGDHGIIVRGDLADGAGPRPVVAFRRGEGFVAFALDGLTDLAPAFAMTVHKAQGSEFDSVVLVLPEMDLPICTREIVYTAITRARRSALIVATEDSLRRALSKINRRHSGVADRLTDLRADR